MRRRSCFVVVPVLIATIALPALAATGNGGPAGPHYTLNIIGVEKAKNSTMTNSNRKTIFVALSKTGRVSSRIYLGPGPFSVCDGNAFDTAWDCDGNRVAAQGAVFRLPADVSDPQVYEIWARALGGPGGSAILTTCATGEDGLEYCSTENVVLVRDRGKSGFSNVSRQLTSLVGDIDGDGVTERYELFRDELEDWYWDYDNNRLRLAQLRFYAVTDIKN